MPAIDNTWPNFPTFPGQSFPLVRVPMWQTRIGAARSGKVTTMADWTWPNYSWILTHNVLRQDTVNGTSWTEVRDLFAFFTRCVGQKSTFLYQDQDDYQITGETLGTGDGTTKVFVLRRTFGGFQERIQAPDLYYPPTIYLNGVAQAASSYSLTPWNTLNANGPGCLIFNTAPANGVVVTGSFAYRWPCRFVADDCVFENFSQNRWAVKKLEFRSVQI